MSSPSLSQDVPIFVVFTMEMPLQPQERHEYFEDRLDEFLQSQPLAEYCGGGTLINKDGSIKAADIELEVNHVENIATLIEQFEQWGAAKGSVARFENNQGQTTEMAFGKNEGMALSLDVNVLNDDNRCTQEDIDNLYAAISQTLDQSAQLSLSGQEIDDRYVIYFYGPSFTVLEQRLRALWGHFSALENARIEQIA